MNKVLWFVGLWAAGVGVVAKAQVDRVGAGTDRRLEHGQVARRTDQFHRKTSTFRGVLPARPAALSGKRARS